MTQLSTSTAVLPSRKTMKAYSTFNSAGKSSFHSVEMANHNTNRVPTTASDCEGVHIRRAITPDDAMAIARILFESFIEYRHLYTPRAFSATAIAGREVEQRLSEGPAWLATTQTGLIGTVSAVRRRDELYVRGMAVVPSARGQAVGWRLLEEVEKFANASGCRRLVLSTTPFLARAIHLYERYGFKAEAEGPPDLFATPLFTMVKASSVNS